MGEYQYHKDDRNAAIKRRRELVMRMQNAKKLISKKEEDEKNRISPKLEIGETNDKYEQEADAVAQKVVYGSGIDNGMNRSNASPNIQMKEEEEEEGTLMAKSENGTLNGTEALQSTLDSTKGTGNKLDTKTQTEMGQKMGTDLSDVKIHTDSKAHEMSEGINAKAFTHGQDIYFEKGNFDTNSNQGKELLAHELAHTQQQKGGLNRKVQRELDPEFDDHKAKRLLDHRISAKTKDKILEYFKVKDISEIKGFWRFTYGNSLLRFIHALKLKDYQHYPREIGATLLEVEEATRLQWLLNLLKNDYDGKDKFAIGIGIKATLLMQGFSTGSLQTIKDAEGGVLYSRLNDLVTGKGIVDIIQSSVAGFQEKKKEWQTTGTYTDSARWKDYVVTANSADATADQMQASIDETNSGIAAYRMFDALLPKDKQILIERRPEVYSNMESGLPPEFLRTEDFGLTKGHDDMAPQKKQALLQKLLKNKVFLQYKALNNDPYYFSLLYEMAGLFRNILTLEDEDKDYQANVDRHKIVHDILYKKYKIYNEHALNFIMPHYEKLYQEAADKPWADELIEERGPRVLNDEAYRISEIQKYIVFYMDDDLGDFINEFTDLFTASLLSSDEGMKSNFVTGTGSASDNLLSKTLHDASYSSIYFKARGLALSLEQESTYKNTDSLRITLRMVVQSGLQEDAEKIIQEHFYQKGLKETYPEALITLAEKGFLESGYSPAAGTLTSNTKQTTPTKNWVQKIKWLLNKENKLADPMDGMFANITYALMDQGDRLKVTNLSLTKTQELMGGHLMGMEFTDTPMDKSTEAAVSSDEELSSKFDTEASKKSGAISAEVNEKEQFTSFQAYYLPFKGINIMLPSKTFKSEKGHVAGLTGIFKWPETTKSERGETTMNIKEFTASDITFAFNDSVYGIGKISVKNIVISMNQAIGTETQLKNLSNVATQIMNILYNMSMLVANAAMAMTDTLTAGDSDDDQVKIDPTQTNYQPLVDLKNALNIEFDNKFVLDFSFNGLELSNIISSTSGVLLDKLNAGYNRLFVSTPEAFYQYLLERINNDKEKLYFDSGLQGTMKPEEYRDLIIEFVHQDRDAVKEDTEDTEEPDWYESVQIWKSEEINKKQEKPLSQQEINALVLSEEDITAFAEYVSPVLYKKYISKALEKNIETVQKRTANIIKWAKEWKTIPPSDRRDRMNLFIKEELYDTEGLAVSLGFITDANFSMDGKLEEQPEEDKGSNEMIPPILPLQMFNPAPAFWEIPLTEREMDEIINFDLQKLYSLSNILEPKK